MYLNGHYIDHIFGWNKDAKFEIKSGEPTKYISIRESKEDNIDHKLTFLLTNKNTAKILEELFSNSSFNVVTVTDFYIDKYNGIYNLVKGTINLDAGRRSYTGTLWLQNRSDMIRFGANQELFNENILVDNISTKAGLPNATASGTWTDGSGFIYPSAGSNNRYYFGYEHWNSYILEFEASTSDLSEYFGFIFNFITTSDYYRFYINGSLSTEHHLYLDRYISTVNTTINVAPTTKFSLAVDTYYKIKAIVSNGKIEIYIDGELMFSHFFTEITSGQIGLYSQSTYSQFKNISVTEYIPEAISIPTGIDRDNTPHKNVYDWTSRGLLQSNVNYSQELLTRVYTSRFNVDEIRVWDTMDNDFSQTYVPPQPLKWQRVYSIDHDFKGNMFIENGMTGLLTTPSGLFHYIYNDPYVSGNKVDIDFKQNPNYNVWNESYGHRSFHSYNQGQSNWDEDGLNFEGVYKGIGYVYPTASLTIDRVQNDIRIPEYKSGIFDNVGDRLECTFTPIITTRYEGTYETLIGMEEWANGRRLGLHYNEVTFTVFATIYDLTGGAIRTVSLGATLVENVQTTIVVINNGDQDGIIAYQDGILVSITDTYTYLTEGTVEGKWTIGNSPAGVAYDDPFTGNISQAKVRMPNRGKTVTRQLRTPLVWHSFDEVDWDNVNSVFVDKGSAGLDLSITNSCFLKKNGRYNEAIYCNSGSVYTTPTTQLDNLGDITIEFWFKFLGTVSTTDYLLYISDSVHGSDLIDIKFTATDFIVGTASGTITVPNSSLTMDTDQKWHHIAVVLNFTNQLMTLYIDGVSIDTSSIPLSNVSTTPDSFVIDGYDMMMFDEFIISDYPKQPHEFGVMIPEIYQTGQWYNEYEFNTDEFGGRYRNNKPSAVFELDYIDGFINRINDGLTLVNGGIGDNSLCPTKVGLGFNYGEYDTTGLYPYVRIDDIDYTKNFTLQFYYIPLDFGTNTNMIRFLFPSGSEYLQQYSDNLYLNGGSLGTQDLVVGTTYQISIVNKKVNGLYYWDVYIDGVKDISDSLRLYQEKGTRIYFGSAFSECQGKYSNITIHYDIIPPSKMGIFVDTQSLPKYAGEIKKYNTIPTAQASSFSKYRLRKIDPYIVEFDIQEDDSLAIIPAWLESGNHFAYFDLSKLRTSSSGHNGLQYAFPTGKHNRPRFALGSSEGSNTIHDTGLSESDGNFTSAENGMYLFDFHVHDMIFVQGCENPSDYTNDYTVYSDSDGKISTLRSDVGKGITWLGYIPQRSVNEMFFDATQLVNINATFSDDSGNWYLAGTSSGTGVEVLTSVGILNYDAYPKGLYGILWRTRQSSGTGRLYNWNDSGASTINLVQPTSTSYDYTTSLFLNITSQYDVLEVELISKADSGAIIVDYLVIFPLTNGIDMPLDYYRRAKQKTRKTKVLE